MPTEITSVLGSGANRVFPRVVGEEDAETVTARINAATEAKEELVTFTQATGNFKGEPVSVQVRSVFKVTGRPAA